MSKEEESLNPKDTSFSEEVKRIVNDKLERDRFHDKSKILKLLSTSIKANKEKIKSIAESGGMQTVIYTCQDRELCSLIRNNLHTAQNAFGFTYSYRSIQQVSWMGFSKDIGCYIELSWQ